MRSKYKWIFTLMIALSVQFSFAQEKTVTGTVSDATGTLPSANVQVQGTKTSTQTDLDGKYSIKAKVGDVLVFSYVGMSDATAKVGAGSVYNAKLSEAVLETVYVNSGFFKKDSNKVSTAVSVVSGEEFVKQSPSVTPLNALQGKAAGVQVTSINGQPGQSAYVTIRGAVKVGAPSGAGIATGNNAGALYVVDGAYMREEEFRTIASGDIENFTVLKDGASAAIYGIRGGNGVIVVTTKKGSNGKAKFELSTSYGFTDILKDPVTLMNGAQKLQYENDLQDGPGFSSTSAELALLKSYEHNWKDDLLRTGTIENLNFSVRGGSEKLTNYFSMGIMKNTGNIRNIDGYKRLTGNFTSNYNASDKLNIGVNFRGSYEKNTLPRDRYNAQNPFYGVLAYNGYEPVFERDALGNIVLDANGQPAYNFTSQGFAIAEAIIRNPEEERFFNGYFRPNLNYKITNGLNFDVAVSLNYERRQREYFIYPGSILDGYVGNPASPGSKTDNGHDRLETQFVPQLNYKFNIKENHNFDLRLMYDYQTSNFRAYSNTRTGFVGVYPTAGTTPTGATSARTEASQFGYFAGADYDFKGKYLLSLTGRKDFSSLLGAENRSKFSKGGSLAWVVSKEDFFKSSIINNLKFRVSYGELNNTLGIDRYANVANFGTTNYGGAIATTFLGGNVGSPEISFEQIQKTDFGFDLKMFNNRLSLSSSYFVNKNTDFIFNGFAPNHSLSTLINAGEFTVKGYEVEMKAFAIKNNSTTLSFYANVGAFDRKINALADNNADLFRGGFNMLRVGYSPDSFFLVKYAGIDQTNGDALYYKLDGSITNVYSSNDRQISDKSPYAKYEGGFGMEFEYKGFELGTDFVFKSGNYIYNLRYSDLVSDGINILQNQSIDALDYWTPTNTNASQPAPFQLNGIDSNQTSDRFLEDGSYIRFRNLNFGYSFKKAFFKNMPLDKVRVYTQIQNLYTWSKFNGDPEIGIGNLEGTTVIPGAFAGYSYPNVKTVMFGLTVNF